MYTKVIKSLIINQIAAKKMRKSKLVVQLRAEKQLAAFYFKAMRAKFLRIKRYREIKSIARDFHQSGRVRRVFKGWNRAIKDQKEFFSNFKQRMIT